MMWTSQRTFVLYCLCNLLSRALSSTPYSSLTPDQHLLFPRQNSSFPQIKDILRYFTHGSFVLGNTLYIDGGEFTTTDFQLGSQINNWTYAIDLSHPFSTVRAENAKLPLTWTIDKGACPSFVYSAYWVNEFNEEAYIWSGEYDTQHQWIGASTVPPEALWVFTTENMGTWTQIPQVNDVTFDGMIRATFGTSTYGGDTGGFYLGGWHGKWNSPQITVDGFSPSVGLAFYNYTERSWSKFSSSGLYEDGTYFGGVQGGSQFVPNYGDNGLVVVFGGQQFDTEWLAGMPYPFDNITVFDLATKTWYSQPTTGDAPQVGKRLFCSVGRQSPSGTYEIFVYGGTSEDHDVLLEESDAMHILTLPAFVWYKIDATSGDSRYQHSCNIAGNRQMLTVGGLNPIAAGAPDPENPLMSQQTNTTDPFVLGVKVFDLTTLNWTNEFNPSAEPYEQPQIIKDHYNQESPYPSQWRDEGLKTIFMTTSSFPSESPSPSASPTANKSDAHGSTNTGVIVGSVIGGLAALVVLGVFFWWIRKKSFRHNRAVPVQAIPNDGTELFEIRETARSRARLYSESAGSLWAVGQSSPRPTPPKNIALHRREIPG